MKSLKNVVISLVVAGSLVAAGQVLASPKNEALAKLRSEAPDNAAAYFINLKDGDVVDQTFTVRFGLSGMGVAPAGVDKDNTGHHHLLIDLDELPPLDMPLPATDNVKHFGKGQTETTVTLAPGTHTLQLLLGNHLHIPHNPPAMSEKITVTVR